MAQDFKTTRIRTITEETVVEITAEQLEAILTGKFGGKDKKVDIWWDDSGQTFGGATVTITKTNTHDILFPDDMGVPLPVGEPPRMYGTPFEHGTCYTDNDGVHRPHIFVAGVADNTVTRCERCGEEPHDA